MCNHFDLQRVTETEAFDFFLPMPCALEAVTVIKLRLKRSNGLSPEPYFTTHHGHMASEVSPLQLNSLAPTMRFHFGCLGAHSESGSAHGARLLQIAQKYPAS